MSLLKGSVLVEVRFCESMLPTGSRPLRAGQGVAVIETRHGTKSLIARCCFFIPPLLSVSLLQIHSVKGLVLFAAYPKPMQQNGQLSGNGHDGPFLSILSATLSEL
jgi:hypothetical protein